MKRNGLTKELLREQAIEWQNNWENESMEESIEKYEYFDKYADFFGLREEFVENGILGEWYND